MDDDTTEVSTSEEGRTIGAFLLHQPVAILGAAAMFSVLHSFVAFLNQAGTEGTVVTWVNPFQAVTWPVWDGLLDREQPAQAFWGFVKDYLTAAVVFIGIWFWYGITVLRFRLAAVPFALLYGAFWPLAILVPLFIPGGLWTAVRLLGRSEGTDWGGLVLFRDMFVWLIIFALIFTLIWQTA